MVMFKSLFHLSTLSPSILDEPNRQLSHNCDVPGGIRAHPVWRREKPDIAPRA